MIKFVAKKENSLTETERVLKSVFKAHEDSELWGENGLLLAHMRSYEALEEDNSRMREALMKLRDCDWATSLPNRMDAVRDIAKRALNE